MSRNAEEIANGGQYLIRIDDFLPDQRAKLKYPTVIVDINVNQEYIRLDVETERIEADDFNPNVSLEVGYMFALKKPVCLLKDKTLKTLHTALVGKLYRVFDPQDPASSVPPVLTQWLEDKGIG